jgi:hypothetical protein
MENAPWIRRLHFGYLLCVIDFFPTFTADVQILQSCYEKIEDMHDMSIFKSWSSFLEVFVDFFLNYMSLNLANMFSTYDTYFM